MEKYTRSIHNFLYFNSIREDRSNSHTRFPGPNKKKEMYRKFCMRKPKCNQEKEDQEQPRIPNLYKKTVRENPDLTEKGNIFCSIYLLKGYSYCQNSNGADKFQIKGPKTDYLFLCSHTTSYCKDHNREFQQRKAQN